MSPADLAGRRFRLASPRTALALGILFAVVVLALVPLSLLARQSPQVNGGEALGAVPFGVVGFMLAWRVPRNPIGWLFLAIGICLLLSIDSGFYAVISYPLGHHLPLGPAALFLYELWGPALSLFALVVLLFPDGTLPARSSRAIMCLFVAVLVGFTAALGVAVAGRGGRAPCGPRLVRRAGGHRQRDGLVRECAGVFRPDCPAVLAVVRGPPVRGLAAVHG